MKFEQIDLDQNDWNYFFPVEICSMLANEENRYFIGGENDEGELTCVAAYIHNSQLPGELMLVYIFTLQSEREKGWGRAILDFSKSYFAKYGIDSIYVKFVEKLDDAMYLDDFFENSGFIPLNLSGEQFLYRMSKNDEMKILKPVTASKLMNYIEKIEDLKDKRLVALLAKQHETGYGIDWDYSEKELSRYYIKNNEIHGVIQGKWLDEESLFISGIYLDEVAKKDNMFLPMLAGLLVAAGFDEFEAEKNVLIEIQDQFIEEGLRLIMNPAREEWLIHEYMLGVKNNREER